MTPMRLEPAAPWSRVKYSTTVPLRSLTQDQKLKYLICQTERVFFLPYVNIVWKSKLSNFVFCFGL